MTALSQGTLLGGRVRYAQPIDGYRTGIEPVLLAACIPARPGQRVLEAGTGSGAGLLCLMARVPGLMAQGVEIDPAMAAIIRGNLVANAFEATIHVGNVADAARHGPVDHAFANPPWHDPAGTLPASPGRARAKHRAPEGLTTWISGLAPAVDAKGTLSLVLPATLLAQATALLPGTGFGRITILPLWPRPGLSAKLILLQARRGALATHLAAGLSLHDESGFTDATQAILRQGKSLPL